MEELDAAGLLATPARPAPRQIEFEDIVRLTYLRCVIKVPPPHPPRLQNPCG